MGGFFGAVSNRDVVLDVFFGTDYHSHLGTRNAGLAFWDGERGCYALRVRGDSMINAGILDGDKVVVRPQQTADNGEIVVALLDDSATVKRFHKDGSTVWLMPENPAYDPIDGTQAQILGKVKAVIRTY